MKKKTVGLIEHIVREKAERSFVQGSKNLPKKLIGKAYGKAAGKVADKTFNYSIQKVIESVSHVNSDGMVEGSEEELLSRNPQNLKLIILPKWKLLNRDGDRVYRFNDTRASLRKWELYDTKRKIATLKEKKQSFFQKVFHRKQDRRDFVIKIKGEETGLLQTAYEDDVRVGETDFDDWYVREEKIYISGRCMASYEKVKSWADLRYVLDYSKELDEVRMILVLFAMKIADEQRRLS